MAGWTIVGGDLKTHTITSLVVAPGAHVVLAASGDRAANGDIKADYVYGTGVPLYNASGRVILKSSAGAIVDRVEWSAPAGFPIPAGRSISLGLPSSDNALGANWCESTMPFGVGDFGSPGAENSCELPLPPPAVVISEVMRNPAAVGDSNGEWFEVHNTTAAPVNLAGWTITDDASDRHVIKGSLVVPGGRLPRAGSRHRPRAQRWCDGCVLVRRLASSSATTPTPSCSPTNTASGSTRSTGRPMSSHGPTARRSPSSTARGARADRSSVAAIAARLARPTTARRDHTSAS